MTLFTSLLATQNPVFVGATDYPMHPDAQGPWPADNYVAHAEKPSWTLLDGPPYANGDLHLGHVRNKLLKDVMARAATQQGHTVKWQAGWDCHGLPVERNVEQLGFSKNDKLPFMAAARQYAMEQTLRQKAQLESLGTCNDMDHAYRTMDPKQQANTLRVFADMVEQDSVYSAYKPVPWCCACESTVAQFETEDAAHTTKDLYFAVKFSDNTHALVWTTQAWSLLGHDALLVNPSTMYGLYTMHGKQVWLAETTAAETLKLYDLENLKASTTKLGSEFADVEYTLQWTAVPHKVTPSESVNALAGTGWLHASAACSEDDFASLQQAGASMASLHNQPMQTDGMCLATGLPMGQTHAAVCQWYLDNDAVLTKVMPVKRDKAHCWRHKTPLTVRAARQWYVRLTPEVRERAQTMVSQVAFVPANGTQRLLDNVMKRPDWCVSRQRTWGVPLALYADEHGVLAPFAVDEMRTLADKMEVDGAEAVHSLPDTKGHYALCTDVLDVWFDSGACFLTTSQTTPDVVVEGHDQHRGWFQSSLLVAAVLNTRLPYKRVVTHGFVLAKAGEKLSKSQGGDAANAKNKTALWTELPPDVLRVWAVQGAVGSDKMWNTVSVAQAQQAYQKWRNTWRFVVANTTMTEMPSPHALLDAERWMVHTTQDVVKKVLAAWTEGYTETAFDLFNDLCVKTLSQHAFSMLKDRLYCGAYQERSTAQWTLAQVGKALEKVMRCVLPGAYTQSVTYLPTWWTTLHEVPMNAQHHWNDYVAYREDMALAWSAHVTKGKGGLQWANAVLPHDCTSVPTEDRLQWLGCSNVTAGSEEVKTVMVSVMDGELCPRCRWVVLNKCERCETRVKV